MSIIWGFMQKLRSLLALPLIFLVAGCTPSTPELPDGHYFRLSNENYQLEVTAVAEDSMEFSYVQNGTNDFPSFSRATDTTFQLQVEETEEGFELRRGQLTAIISKASGRVDFFKDGQLLTVQQPYETGATFNFNLTSQEKIMGGGQRVLGMDRRGHKLPLYNRAHYGYETESSQMNYSLPAVMSNKQYYLLFDNTASGTLDIGATEPDLLSFSAVGGRTAYIIGADASYPDLIDEYTDVTGKPAMLPRWALGHFISRFGYHTQSEVTEVVDLTLDKGIPADAVILDLYWFGQGIKGFMGNLAWDKNDFPEPDRMVDDLTTKGIKTILITEPFILTTSNRWQEAVDAGAIATTTSGAPYRFDFYFGNTGLVDVFSARGRNWFAARYLELFEQGIAGNWGDLGEPEVHPDDIQHYLQETGEWVRGDVLHNAYGHEWAKLVYDTQKSVQPNSRPFILMRSGFAGTQRFGIIPWTGDVNRSWGGLKPQVELSLQMSLFGLGYTHSDIGGFAGTEGYSPELYLRWSQYGIFQPIYRPHAQEQIASEVVFQDDAIRDIVTDFINLRYRMTPYNYSLFHEHTQTGMPLMRPMFFSDETDPALIDMKDQYMWGDAFLVKPVTSPGSASESVWLPEGYWFNYWTGEGHQGARSIDIDVSIRDIPVLVKAGSFIPMVPEMRNMAQYSSSELELHYYHHESVTSSHSEMYEDDGISANAYSSNDYELLSFTAQSTNEELVINLGHNGQDYDSIPENREMTILVHGLTQQPSNVTSNHLNLWQYDYDKDSMTLTATFNWSYENATITISK